MSCGSVRLGALALLLLALDACDSSPSTAGIDRGGVRAPIAAQGPITGFGSIVVNGVHYDVRDAAITINGDPAAESALALGQLVTVVGEREVGGTMGVAHSVSFEANVRGPVESVDAPGQSLTVLGQRIVASGATVLALGSAGLGELRVGDPLEASGFTGTGGLIEATLIGRAPADGRLRVLGTVERADPARFRFEVGGLVVDYSAAAVIDGLPAGRPETGDRLIAEGVERGGSGELLAEVLRAVVAESSIPQPGREAEVEGLVTRFATPADFAVAGFAASANAATRYEGGDATHLQLNVKVKVVGETDEHGVIRASKIEIKDGGRVVTGD